MRLVDFGCGAGSLTCGFAATSCLSSLSSEANTKTMWRHGIEAVQAANGDGEKR
jgi:hypothetical protein